MSASIELGAFVLDDEIGEGGMGSVWRATHAETDLAVAVKVIRGVAGREARAQFHKEVQAHAALGHPGIVYLFDYGQIDESAAAAEGLRAGSPYVAMELADRGTVRDAMPVDSWPAARAILVQILDALAFSHARGVIHRDLKPENLLRFRDDDAGDTRIKLADFGIAHALGKEHEAKLEELELTAGTPLYMPPEQLRGNWRQYGPWTDLYSLGCIAWELVCGRAPFVAKTATAVAIRHATSDRPPIEPRFAVPDGLEDWIHRMMAIEPTRRFRRAADALWALPTGESDGVAATHTATGDTENDRDETAEAPTVCETTRLMTLASTLIVDQPEPALAVTVVPDDAGHPAATTRAKTPPTLVGDEAALETPEAMKAPAPPTAAPPIPVRWRPEQTSGLPAPLVGAGLGLFGLREPPFVNRREECDRIWEALRQVADTNCTRLVVLEGEAGTGKSRTAEWLTTRAHEVGAANIVRAVHTHSRGASDGLRAAFEQVLRTVKMPREKVYDHLCERLDVLSGPEDDAVEADARALTEYLRPTDEDTTKVDGPTYQFADAEHRRTLIARTLKRLARHRPLVLWLDDLQWGAAALGVVEHLAEMTSPPKMLVLATVRSDLVADDPGLAERLDGLRRLDWSQTITVDALSRTHQRQLLEGLLPLENQLAQQLAERTEGHPLFAMQLLGHWIDKAVITDGPQGFRVPEGRDAHLPEDIHELWMERIERIARRYPQDAGADVIEALELGAALGRQVVRREWDALLDQSGVNAPPALVERLVARGLARRTDEGITFAHGLLVESLERHARQHQRWRHHHRRCAKMLRDRRDDTPVPDAPRVARHLLEAGDDAEALDPLLEALRYFRIVFDTEQWQHFYDEYRDALQRLDVDDDDRRAVVVELERATFYHRHVRIQDAEPLLEHCHATCQRRGWDKLLAKTLRGRAANARMKSSMEQAESYARQALELYRQLDAPRGIGHALKDLGWILSWKGEHEPACLLLKKAKAQFRRVGETHGEARVLFYLAAIHVDLKRYSQAVDFADSARQVFEQLGDLRGICDCLNTLGECHRFQGNLQQAIRDYHRAIDVTRRMGMTRVMILHLNVGVVHLMRGDFESAREYLEEALDRANTQNRPTWLAAAHSGMLACTAGLNRFDPFDEHLRRTEEFVARTSMIQRDIPLACEIAAEQALQAHHPDRAGRALQLALDQWKQVEDEKAIERVERQLRRLDGRDDPSRG